MARATIEVEIEINDLSSFMMDYWPRARDELIAVGEVVSAKLDIPATGPRVIELDRS